MPLKAQSQGWRAITRGGAEAPDAQHCCGSDPEIDLYSSDASLSIGRGDSDIGIEGSMRIVISLAKGQGIQDDGNARH
jgi:hypothetical protein